MPRPRKKPTVQLPKPGVPEILTLEGKFVRAAYNNEGYVILGYQATNRSIPGVRPSISLASLATNGCSSKSA